MVLFVCHSGLQDAYSVIRRLLKTIEASPPSALFPCPFILLLGSSLVPKSTFPKKESCPAKCFLAIERVLVLMRGLSANLI